MMLKDKFLAKSDDLDKQSLERSALAALHLRKRKDQSRDYVKVVPKRSNSRDVSPMFEQQLLLAKDRDRAKALKTLLEANARWNASDSDIWSFVDETSTINPELRKELLYSWEVLVDETITINPELRKELLYSWEEGFIEDKPNEEQNNAWSPVLLRNDENRKSGKALTNYKGKVTSQTPSTVKTAAGAIYRKIYIAQSKIKSPLPLKIAKNAKSPKLEDAKKKRVGTNAQLQETLHSEDEDNYKNKADDTKATEPFQDSPVRVTSRNTEPG